MSRKTLAEEQAELHEAVRELLYQIARATRLLTLLARIGLRPKPWLQAKIDRDADVPPKGYA